MNHMSEIRKARGLTQEALAEKVGITQAVVSRYESGDRFPKLTIAAKIAEALGCKVDDLIDKEGS